MVSFRFEFKYKPINVRDFLKGKVKKIYIQYPCWVRESATFFIKGIRKGYERERVWTSRRSASPYKEGCNYESETFGRHFSVRSLLSYTLYLDKGNFDHSRFRFQDIFLTESQSRYIQNNMKTDRPCCSTLLLCRYSSS